MDNALGKLAGGTAYYGVSMIPFLVPVLRIEDVTCGFAYLGRISRNRLILETQFPISNEIM